jgi:hypothetical protein
MRVSVYFNLHRRLFSVRAEEGPAAGRVIAHARHVTLGGHSGCSFVVQEGGRQRVLAEGRKNVHAFVRGELEGMRDYTPAAAVEALGLRLFSNFDFARRHCQTSVAYNPRVASYFFAPDGSRENGRRPIDRARRVLLTLAEGERARIFADELA